MSVRQSFQSFCFSISLLYIYSFVCLSICVSPFKFVSFRPPVCFSYHWFVCLSFWPDFSLPVLLSLTFLYMLFAMLKLFCFFLAWFKRFVHLSRHTFALQIFQGNYERNYVVTHRFLRPFKARYVRLHPITWYGHISMRFELYGCRLGKWRSLRSATSKSKHLAQPECIAC